jgi:hypothetical protein
MNTSTSVSPQTPDGPSPRLPVLDRRRDTLAGGRNAVLAEAVAAVDPGLDPASLLALRRRLVCSTDR